MKNTKISNALKGRQLTDEHKKCIGQGVKKAWKNREHNGHNIIVKPKHSEEAKKKMSESHKRPWKKIKEA